MTDDPLEQRTRCRRLGHDVAFGYCLREQAEGRPCRLILDCWWERFDVRQYLREHLTEEEYRQVEEAAAAPPPDKMTSLVEMIRAAKERASRAEKEDVGREPRDEDAGGGA